MLELFEIVFLLITLPLIRFRSSFNELISDLLIFPSYLYHDVGKNLSEEDRVVISFNIRIQMKIS